MLLSAAPFLELRFGIPAAILGGINPLLAFVACTLANFLIVLPIWLFLDYLHIHLFKINIYKKIYNNAIKKVRTSASKLKKEMEVYGWIALTVFVGIPLPATGAYTAALIVWLTGLDRKKSFFAIALGVAIAGVIVTLGTLGIKSGIAGLLSRN